MKKALSMMFAGAVLSALGGTGRAFPFHRLAASAHSPWYRRACGYGWWRGPWGQCVTRPTSATWPDGSNTYRPDCPRLLGGPWGNAATRVSRRLPGGDLR